MAIKMYSVSSNDSHFEIGGKGAAQTRQSLHDQFVAQRLREKKDFLKRQLEALRKLNQRLTGGEKGRQ
jgi:hypothetical protein